MSLAQANFSRALGPLPRFDGKARSYPGVDVWIRRVEIYARLYGINQEQTTLLAESALTGIAADWSLSRLSGLDPDEAEPWNIFKEALRQRFYPANFAEKAKDEWIRISRRSNEDIASYNDRFIECWQRLPEGYTSELLTLDHYMGTLAAELQHHICGEAPTTLERAMFLTTQAEASILPAQGKKFPGAWRKPEPKNIDVVDHKDTRSGHKGPSKGRNFNSTKNRGGGGTGYSVNHCPRRCYGCGSANLKRDCSAVKGEKASSKILVSTPRTSVDANLLDPSHENLVLPTFSVQGRKAQALLDSGAATDINSGKLVEDLGLPTYAAQEINLVGAFSEI